MKNNYKKIILATMISAVGTSAFAIGNGNAENLFETKNFPEEIVEHCKNMVDGIPNEAIKKKEAQKCVFMIDQQIKVEQLNTQLKTVKQDKESILALDVNSVRTTDLLIKTVENFRKAILIPEGKTQEFERVSIFYKDPNIELKEKEKQAKAYYKRFNEKNYKVSKEVYEAFKEINTKLNDQKQMVVKVEKELMKGMPVQDIEKALKKIDKNFNKEMKINNEILKDYDTYIMARKLDAQNALNKVVEGKKVKLSKKECNLLDTMYYKYEINTFKNLTCK